MQSFSDTAFFLLITVYMNFFHFDPDITFRLDDDFDSLRSHSGWPLSIGL